MVTSPDGGRAVCGVRPGGCASEGVGFKPMAWYGPQKPYSNSLPVELTCTAAEIEAWRFVFPHGGLSTMKEEMRYAKRIILELAKRLEE